MSHPSRFVLPITLFLALVAALPMIREASRGLGLAQVISAVPTHCLDACDRSAETSRRACAHSGADEVSCDLAVVEARNMCVQRCTDVSPTLMNPMSLSVQEQADTCENVIISLRVVPEIYSGSVEGEPFRGNGCPVAVSRANEACRAEAEKAIDEQVNAKCAQACRGTGIRSCSARPTVANVVVRGCDLSAAEKVDSIAPGGDGAWVLRGNGAPSDSEGFCFARSSTQRAGIIADLNCNCGAGE